MQKIHGEESPLPCLNTTSTPVHARTTESFVALKSEICSSQIITTGYEMVKKHIHPLLETSNKPLVEMIKLNCPCQ